VWCFPPGLFPACMVSFCQNLSYEAWFFHQVYFSTLRHYKPLTIRYYPTAAKSSKYMKRMIEANKENNVSVDSFKNE
jgi:hypothetical protein